MGKLLFLKEGDNMKQEITYQDIADFFIALSNSAQDLITNLKLQKLLYYTQAWYLAINNKPLFDGTFQAWVHGPVLPELYNEYKNFRWMPIERNDLTEKVLDKLKEKFGEQISLFMDDIVKEYFGLSAYQLETLVHSEEPWKKARLGLNPDEPSTNSIQNEWMSEYYRQFSN
jgi:uncharacterized phage-associated protein